MQPHLSRVASFVTLLSLSGCPSEVTVLPGDGGGGSEGTGGDGEGGLGLGTVGGKPNEGGNGGEGAGIGEPSDVYPAPHPPAPTVANLGGPVMDAPVTIPIYFAGDDTALLSGVTEFTQQLGASSYWATTTSEYGVGPAGSLPPITVAEVPASTIDDEEIQAWLAAKLNANDPAFPAPSVNTLFAIYYPDGVTVTSSFEGQGPPATSCIDFGAYHSNTFLDAAHGNLAVPYAVMPRCGEFAGFSGVDSLSIPSSHEFIEAATDPLPLNQPAFGQTDADHIFWSFVLGGEVTDLCAASLDGYGYFPDFDYAAARSWSNASALASHNPCVPLIPNTTYYNAAPVLDDTIDLGGGFVTKAVHIPEGESRTIDVKLFSDGPTPPFYVEPEDITYYLQVGGGLELDFDENVGQNGQTLHLTITVTQASDYFAELFMLRSYGDDGQENVWIGAVGN